MSDPIDNRLASADPNPILSAEATRALNALAARRSLAARRRRIVIPSIVLGSILTLGAGAAAATVWGPWTYVEQPDISISRSWVDVDGTFLGSCQSRLAADGMPADARRAALDYLADVDIDAIDPDPEVVAGALNAVGRLDELGMLVAGADASAFELTHDGEVNTDPRFSNARILQDALVQTIFGEMVESVFVDHPEFVAGGIESSVETQCTTDPGVEE